MITIAGNRVNAQDTELILQGLDANKESLGVSKIMLPEKEKLEHLLNFASIRGVYSRAVGSRPAENIRYQDEKIRLQIQTYKSDNNKGAYDHIAYNVKGVEYVPENKINIKTQITQVPSPLKSLVIKNSFEPTAVIEFCLALDSSSRSHFIDGSLDVALNSLQKKKAAKRLMEIITKNPVMTTDGLTNEIEQLVLTLEISPERFREKRGQWLINNLLNTSDGLEEKNLSKNLDLIAWDFKNNNPPLIDSKIFEKYEKEFVNHKSYFKLKNTFLQKLKDNPLFIDDLEKNDSRMRLVFLTDVPDEQLPSGNTIVRLQEYISTLSDYGQKLVIEYLHVLNDIDNQSLLNSLISKLSVKNQEDVYKFFIKKAIEMKKPKPFLTFIVDVLAQPHTKDMIDVYKSSIKAMVELKDWRVFKSFVEKVLSQPHTMDMVDVYKLFFEKIPKDYLTDVLMVFLEKVFKQDHAKNMAGIKELILKKDHAKNMVGIKELILSKIVESKYENLHATFVSTVMSQPDWGNLDHLHKKYLEKVVDMNNKHLLRMYGIHVLSKPYTKDMIEVYKFYIEKAAEMKDPDSLSNLIIYSLSREHTREMDGVYQLLVKKAAELKDYRIFQLLADQVLTAPHTKKNPFYDLLRKICKKVNGQYMSGWGEVKKMVDNEFEHLEIVNSGKKASGIQQCLSEGLK